MCVGHLIKDGKSRLAVGCRESLVGTQFLTCGICTNSVQLVPEFN